MTLGSAGLFGSFAATTNLATINAACTHAHLNATGKAVGRPTGSRRDNGKGSWLARLAAALTSLWRTPEQGAPGRFLAKKTLAEKTKHDGVA